MLRKRTFAGLLAAASLSAGSAAHAQLEDFTWSGGVGAQSWNQSGNWTPAGVPTGNLHSANFSVPLAGDLTVDAGSRTIAGVTLGGTSGGVTTTIGGTGTLSFQNAYVPDEEAVNADFNGNTFVDGADFVIWQRNIGLIEQEGNENGDANADTVVDFVDYAIWEDLFTSGAEAVRPGRPFILSYGTQSGSNVIDANVQPLNTTLEIAGTHALTINGELSFTADAETGVSQAGLQVRSAGLVVTMNGDINVVNSDAANVDTEGGSVDFYINNGTRTQGTLVVNGELKGDGLVWIGTADNRTP
ncbi:MAG: hypothetical protein KDA61_04695, partial [Planctomycetales bacterium]|nr:hypothetical protein [Planctomycetales bacterium]